VNFQGAKQSFADGGGTDNLALTPLLRRKVRHSRQLSWFSSTLPCNDAAIAGLLLAGCGALLLLHGFQKGCC
jgi:hypothetical protein